MTGFISAVFLVFCGIFYASNKTAFIWTLFGGIAFGLFTCFLYWQNDIWQSQINGSLVAQPQKKNEESSPNSISERPEKSVGRDKRKKAKPDSQIATDQAIPISSHTSSTEKNKSTEEGKEMHESAGISIEGGSADLSGNLIIGYPTGIRSKNAQLSGQGNVIEKGDQPKQFPLPTGEFRNLSNTELLNRVNSFASDMRISESKYDFEILQNKQDVFNKSFLPIGISLASEIIFRLGKIEIPPNASLSVRLGGNVLLRGMLVGPHPMSAAADFLEYIALKLPQGR
jgi:cytoskeletal protein RodZ